MGNLCIMYIIYSYMINYNLIYYVFVLLYFLIFFSYFKSEKIIFETNLTIDFRFVMKKLKNFGFYMIVWYLFFSTQQFDIVKMNAYLNNIVIS